MRVASKVGNLPSKFRHARPLGSRIIRCVRDGRTGRRIYKTNTYCPLPYGRGITNRSKCPSVRPSPYVRANVAQSARCHNLQNRTAPAPLGRRRRHLPCIFYGSRDRSSRSKSFSFGTCAPRHRPQLNPASLRIHSTLQPQKGVKPADTLRHILRRKNLRKNPRQFPPSHYIDKPATPREMTQPEQVAYICFLILHRPTMRVKHAHF